MSEPGEKDVLADRLKLDGAEGPATPLDPAAAAALAAGAARRAAAPPAAAGSAAKLLAAKLLAVATAVGLAGGLGALALRGRPDPAVPPPAPAIPVVPTAPLPAAPDPVPAVSPTAVIQPARVESRRPRPPAADLLAAANAERAARRWRAAEALYGRVLRASPGTDAAATAAVAAAALRLEHLGDPRGALRAYGEALRLRPAGSLAEEALLGRADALRALGDRAGEQAALRELVATHPRSPLAVGAQRRLGAAP